MGDVRGIHVEQRQVGKPALMIVVAMGNDQSLDGLEPVPANLLKQRRAAVHQKTAVTDAYLVADTLSHGGKRAIVPQYPDENSLSCHISPHYIKVPSPVHFRCSGILMLPGHSVSRTAVTNPGRLICFPSRIISGLHNPRYLA